MSDLWRALVILDVPSSRQRLREIEGSIMAFLWENAIVAREPTITDEYPPGPRAAAWVVTPEKWNWPECYLGCGIPHELGITRSRSGEWFGDGNVPHTFWCPRCGEGVRDICI